LWSLTRIKSLAGFDGVVLIGVMVVLLASSWQLWRKY
jgi:hypothetical protein